MALDLIDTHCHLDHPPLSDQAELAWARARTNGVRQAITVGTSLASSRVNVAIAQRFVGLGAAVGIHPNDTEGVTDDDLTALDTLAGERGVVAVGEIGLDNYRHTAAPATQERVFRACVAIAVRRELPILIHCRDAYEPMLALLRALTLPARVGVIHCASGPPEFIQGALALGFYVSFSGTVTFPNAVATRALVPLVPDDRLLIETDAPFLAPQAVRGRMNEPAHVMHTAAHLAQLRGISTEALGTLTSRNARRLFCLPELT